MSAVTQVPPPTGFSLLSADHLVEAESHSQDPKALCNMGLIFRSIHLAFTPFRTQLTVRTGSCRAVAAENPCLRWAHTLLCLVTMSWAWSLHTGRRTQSQGCTTRVVGGMERNRGSARINEVEESTKTELHLARQRVCNSEMQLVTDTNFLNVHVIQHQSEMLYAERPEVEAKLLWLDLQSGF